PAAAASGFGGHGPVAPLELLSGAAGAGIVSSHLGLGPNHRLAAALRGSIPSGARGFGVPFDSALPPPLLGDPSLQVGRSPRGGLSGLLLLAGHHLEPEDLAHDLFADPIGHLLEVREAFLL